MISYVRDHVTYWNNTSPNHSFLSPPPTLFPPPLSTYYLNDACILFGIKYWNLALRSSSYRILSYIYSTIYIYGWNKSWSWLLSWDVYTPLSSSAYTSPHLAFWKRNTFWKYSMRFLWGSPPAIGSDVWMPGKERSFPKWKSVSMASCVRFGASERNLWSDDEVLTLRDMIQSWVTKLGDIRETCEEDQPLQRKC